MGADADLQNEREATFRLLGEFRNALERRRTAGNRASRTYWGDLSTLGGARRLILLLDPEHMHELCIALSQAHGVPIFDGIGKNWPARDRYPCVARVWVGQQRKGESLNLDVEATPLAEVFGLAENSEVQHG